MTPRPTTVGDLDEASFQSWYGRWHPLDPAGVAALLAGSGVAWWIAGGWAARVGAAPRHHEDIDVAVALAELPALRAHLESAWHLWEAYDGSLRPLLPGEDLRPGREQLWLRRDSGSAWEVDLLLHAGEVGDAGEWVFKRDSTIRLPWARALRTVDGVRYLRPKIALLHKAHLDRPKDRADLAAAVLEPDARAWLITQLQRRGHHTWAAMAASSAAAS